MSPKDHHPHAPEPVPMDHEMPTEYRRGSLPELYFRWRGGEITRLEAFCDVVFGFAVATGGVAGRVAKLRRAHGGDSRIRALRRVLRAAHSDLAGARPVLAPLRMGSSLASFSEYHSALSRAVLCLSTEVCLHHALRGIHGQSSGLRTGMARSLGSDANLRGGIPLCLPTVCPDVRTLTSCAINLG